MTKRYPFAASHRLHVPELSDAENRELFGKCNNPYGHGHNYAVEVSIAGAADAATGMIVRREDLDAFVEGAVIERIDHRDLNRDVDEFRDLVPTTENLAVVIENWLRAEWPKPFAEAGLELGGVLVHETAKNRFQVVP